MNFGQALEALKQGKKLQRAGWNGKGLFIELSEPEGKITTQFMTINSNGQVNTWVPSISDCLAEDWQVVIEKTELGQYNL